MTTAFDDADTAAIQAHFTSYAQAWRLNDAAVLLAHWSPEQFRFYKAEEIDRFFLAWTDVAAYFRHNEQFHSLAELEFRTIDVVPLGTDLATAVIRMRWDIEFAPDARLPDGSAFAYRGKAMGGDDHVLTLVVRTSTGWRLAGWSETPDAPITYISQLYLHNVKPGFPPRR